MKLKIKWAKEHQTLIEETLGSVSPSLSWLAGFDFAKNEIAKRAHNHYDDCVLAVGKDTILKFGENEAGNEPE